MANKLIGRQKIIIVMPAYNAANTLKKTVLTLPNIKLEVLVGDDASSDRTSAISRSLGLKTIIHNHNSGYGANQKSLYREALRQKADIVVMIHPDNQYDTSNLRTMINLIVKNKADIVLGNRIKTAHDNHMPWWKFVSNRFLTVCQNIVYQQQLSEYHTGLRAYSNEVLQKLPMKSFSDNFVFDSEFLAAAIAQGFRIAEVDTNCYYNDSVSSISFLPSLHYGVATLRVLWRLSRGYYDLDTKSKIKRN
jgi:glycosyltransferase involved in cell wall biosynthesis